MAWGILDNRRYCGVKKPERLSANMALSVLEMFLMITSNIIPSPHPYDIHCFLYHRTEIRQANKKDN